MPNKTAPNSARYTGFYHDMVNGVIETYYRGTLVYSFNATTATFGAGVNFAFTGSTTGIAMEADLGSTAAIASNGADAILPDVKFVAPKNLQITSVWKENQTASDVTVGTATSSASFRRFTLITNTAGTGSGTNIVASLNATASAASNFTRAFTSVASTVPAGAILMMSHLTVGAATADGTDAAASIFRMSYVFV